MEENPNIGMRVGAGIFLTIMIITIVVGLTLAGQDSAKQGQEKMTTITTTISSTEFNTYANTRMTGSQVLNAIRQYMDQSQFGIQVTTGKGTTSFYGNTFNPTDGTVSGGPSDKNKDLRTAEDPTQSSYINPSGKFSSNIVRDTNDVIVGIVFKQM